MNLSPFGDIQFDDDDAYSDFELAHGAAHDKFADVLFAQGKVYAVYPLYDTPKHDMDWKLNHQQEHQSIYSLLGLTGLPDLATVDFGKADEFSDWMLQHRLVHQTINAKLGIV